MKLACPTPLNNDATDLLVQNRSGSFSPHGGAVEIGVKAHEDQTLLFSGRILVGIIEV
jgi:hypothetical protein